ncbi:hypothetical protein J8273_4024 [Carpediemonas membranifera]|uniref:Uncharacterized protein n=1 Tax=Carpediemonas membranifera TaxID=201153 RepID=A0A8J6AY78_9EUKA|nr:hypothetical protein J8273_4024 [Carpediemonas membranifera]|eukprot:KAG9394380.1 hypothetical protein J8273_4024 [Carpediemonas membranifera]
MWTFVVQMLFLAALLCLAVLFVLFLCAVVLFAMVFSIVVKLRKLHRPGGRVIKCVPEFNPDAVKYAPARTLYGPLPPPNEISLSNRSYYSAVPMVQPGPAHSYGPPMQAWR